MRPRRSDRCRLMLPITSRGARSSRSCTMKSAFTARGLRRMQALGYSASATISPRSGNASRCRFCAWSARRTRSSGLRSSGRWCRRYRMRGCEPSLDLDIPSISRIQPFSINWFAISFSKSVTHAKPPRCACAVKRNCLKFVELAGGRRWHILVGGMIRFAKGLTAILMIVAIAGLAACTPVQNPYGTADPSNSSSQVGTSNGYGSHSTLAAPSSAGTVAGGTIDSPQSQGLSDYLKHHQLPLVGAQVVTSPSGGRQVILFGFVASDFGKTDAEQKARHYLKDQSVVVDNRIKISPELAGSKGGSAGSTVNGVPSANAMPSDGTDPYAESGGIQDYQNNQPPGAYAYQSQGQYQQYSGPPPSAMSLLIPLLMGGSF